MLTNTNIFRTDIKKVHDESNAIENLLLLYSTIDLVYVLAGRGSALKKPIDNADIADPEDDYHRMVYGIEIAKKIYAAKGLMVPFFYNGRTLHNIHLREALEQGIFDYPKELFIISEIDPGNTIGQAKSFQKFLQFRKDPTSVIAIVSSAYHLPRVARTFGKKSPTIKSTFQNNEESVLEKSHLLLFGIDRCYKRPGVEKDIECEIDAMKNYSSGERAKPTISRYQGDNTFLNDTDVILRWSFRLQQRKIKDLPPTTSIEITAKPVDTTTTPLEKRIFKH